MAAWQPSDGPIFAAALVVQLIWYAVMRTVLAPKGAAAAKRAATPEAARRALEKPRAWILSLFIATTFSVASLAYTPKCLQLATQGLQPLAAFMCSDSWVSRPITLAFAANMLLDLAIGSADYRTNLRVDTGWVHHAVYLCIAYWLLSTGRCTLLLAQSVNEVPTMLLGLGSIWAHLRLDLGFGVIYFFTRILYFGSSVATGFVGNHQHSNPPLFPPALLWGGCAIFALHSKWFSDWMASFARSRAKARQLSGAEAEKSADAARRNSAGASLPSPTGVTKGASSGAGAVPAASQ